MSILVTVFLISFIIGVPVAFSLGLAGLAGLFFNLSASSTVAVARMYSAMDSFPLLAIPLFVLMGHIMERCGVLTLLADFLIALLRPVRGGLAHVNVLMSMMFAGVSGTAVADVASLGYMEIKLMEEAGYDKDFSAAVTAASSICGPIIPPSVGMVLFALAIGGGVSIGGLFMAGVIPGILLGVGLIATNMVIIKKKNMLERIRVDEKIGFKPIVKLGFQAWPILLLPIIILGGILSGVFTVTEAAAVGVVYSLFIGFFITKELRVTDIPIAIINAAVTTGTVAMLFGAGSLVSWILTVNQLPVKLALLITSYISSPIVFMLAIMVFLTILGCFMDATASIIMVAPILYPVACSFGIPVYTFGVLFVMTLMIGMITPPVGVVLFVTSSVGEIHVNKIIKAIWPYVIAELLIVILLVFIPGITTFVPRLFGLG